MAGAHAHASSGGDSLATPSTLLSSPSWDVASAVLVYEFLVNAGCKHTAAVLAAERPEVLGAAAAGVRDRLHAELAGVLTAVAAEGALLPRLLASATAASGTTMRGETKVNAAASASGRKARDRK